MTGLSLLHALAESGTSGQKLAPGLALLLRQPAATADEVCAALRAAGVSSVTIQKALALSVATPVQQTGEPEKRRPGRPRKPVQAHDVSATLATLIEQNGTLTHADEVQS